LKDSQALSLHATWKLKEFILPGDLDPGPVTFLRIAHPSLCEDHVHFEVALKKSNNLLSRVREPFIVRVHKRDIASLRVTKTMIPCRGRPLVLLPQIFTCRLELSDDRRNVHRRTVIYYDDLQVGISAP
jgi:hypothetical protein